MKTQNISFIGGGNMARSLIGGLIADGRDPNSIWVTDINPQPLEQLRSRLGVNIATSNTAAVERAEIVILAVKPQVMHSVALEIRDVAQRRKPLIISIAAGVREQDLSQWLGGNLAIVRTMPNTPALIQAGATALYANAQVSAQQHNAAETIMRAVGMSLWLDDELLMDVVTALSGSGPAYFFLVMEALEAAATRLGLPAETARLLTQQTAFGAAKMALETPEDVATLRVRVTSPGGTTEQALKVFENGGLRELIDKAVAAAAHRSAELATYFAQEKK
ncbi:MAG: pyrroline-5-carboxylate reductase [Gammaproteobacteria bacterium]|nr:pyrroline-5-carboxylate reductase [Gammaproteobacteria bacterium]